MTVMKELNRTQILVVVMGMFLLGHPGCGIDVGNAGKPAPDPQLQLANVVGLQHEEALGAILEGEDADRDESALRLMEDADPELMTGVSCTENNADGSIRVILNKEGTSSRDFGRASSRKTLIDDLKVNRTLVWKAKDRVLTCAGTRPSILWAQLNELNVAATYEKTRSRQVTLKSSGSLVAESTVQATGQRTILYEKQSTSTLQQLMTKRTITFKSQLTQQKATETLQRNVGTVDGQPIILQNTLTRGVGRTVRIVSGTVESSTLGAKRIILRYENLDLNPGTSCHPVSGVLKGDVYADLTAASPESTFQVIFSADGAVVRTADGSEEELELESCAL
jgi:hypothetical protein